LKNKASTRVLEKVGFKINKIDFYPGEENDLRLSVREQENKKKLSKKKVNWLVLKKEDYER
jgi:RimJ/RimL family protein N-acetyltransferase